MKPEVIIKNWLMAWFRPDAVTEYNTVSKATGRAPITEANFGEFIGIFKDEKGEREFSEEEAKTVKEIILKPLLFSTGYPLNEKEAIQIGTIYVIEGGWGQLSSHLGANYWHGRKQTHIAITGMTTGETLNMAEPSLLLQMITSFLIAGRNYFLAHHIENPVITETFYAQDEASSYEKGKAIRTLSIAYEAERHGVITQYGVNKDG